MVKKAYIKSTFRLFRRHIVRLLSIAAIFIVSSSLVSGISNVETDIKSSITALYNDSNIQDFSIIAINASKKVDEVFSVANSQEDKILSHAEKSYFIDVPDENDSTETFSKRYCFDDIEHNVINKYTLVDGRYPLDINEIVVEQSTKDFLNHKIGDEIKIKFGLIEMPFKICGILRDPLIVNKSKEPSVFFDVDDKDAKNRYLNDIYYFSPDIGKFLRDTEKFTNLSITIKDRELFDGFSSTYEDKIAIIKEHIKTIADKVDAPSDSAFTITSLNESYGVASLNMYAEKVGALGFIFVIFFALITILVVYSTVSRLMDEDRPSIAVLKTLGYKNRTIIFRYFLFTLIGALIGIALAVIPTFFVGNVIVKAFSIQFYMKEIALPIVSPRFFLINILMLSLCLILILVYAFKEIRVKPVLLLTRKAPKVGKQILLEKIKFIWNKLSFKYKSTFRNVFLFKARFFMTVLSVIASTVIVFASFALLDNSLKIQGTESLRTISLVLLIFSGALCALVVYNITNINVSERTREIATLMVLGYRNNENTGYIYREIYIMSILGAILGLPAGVAFVYFVFGYVDFGNLGNINWWTYIITPIITFIFTVIATYLLYPKIVKIDMNDSLKVLE